MSTSVAVIGNFDGVHKGHRALLDAARAAEPGADVVAVTFWPHPMSVVRPDKAPKLLCTLPERIRLLTEAGCARVQVVDFTADFSTWAPERFVDEVLAPLGLARVVVGENFRFGHRASGDVTTLAKLCAAHGIAVTVVPLVQIDDGDACSTRIRQALAEGDLDSAAEQLGRRFAFRGTVVQGAQRGRELGFPTANVLVPDALAAPADGVYAGWLRRLDVADAPRWPAAISVGTNPTFDDVHRTVESYVLDRTDLELYGAEVEVEFVAHLRGMVKFTGMEPLIEQMRRDVDDTRMALGDSARG